MEIKNLVLSLTGECNYKCSYCYAAQYDKEKMTFDTAKKAIDLVAKDSKNFILQFSGGEPLLAYDLIKKIVQYIEIEKINAIMQIQTNGSLINDEIALFFKKHKIGVGVSLDGRIIENDLQRKLKDGSGAFKSTIRGINILGENNVAIGLTCVVTNKNVEALKGIVEVAYYLGNVRKIGFDLLKGKGRGNEMKAAKPKILEKSLQEVYDLALFLEKESGIKINFSQIESGKLLQKVNEHTSFRHCYAMNGQAAFVDVKGEIYACSSLIGDKNFYIGNVDEGINFNLVNNIKAQIKEYMNFCFKCEDFKKCGGGCFARSYAKDLQDSCLEECVLKKISAKYAINRG